METAEQITYLWIKRQGGGGWARCRQVLGSHLRQHLYGRAQRGGAAAVGGAGVRSSQSASVLQEHQRNPPIMARLCSSVEEA